MTVQTRSSNSDVFVALTAVAAVDLVAALAYREWALLAVGAGVAVVAAERWRRARLEVEAKWAALTRGLAIAAVALATLTVFYVLIDDGDIRLYGALMSGGLLTLGVALLSSQRSRRDRMTRAEAVSNESSRQNVS